ncbi:MAG: EutN/CcmL family microcompartment protein [Actinobacteria bacterium]|nr:EutN/CcmL family microcompartment protein [Actinomycetota bacterium]
MIIGKVIGNVVSTVKDPKYNGYKLLVVQEMNAYGQFEKNFYISADLIGVGIDEVVMLVNGAAARTSVETYNIGFDSVITAKIETVIFEDKVIKL